VLRNKPIISNHKKKSYQNNKLNRMVQLTFSMAHVGGCGHYMISTHISMLSLPFIIWYNIFSCPRDRGVQRWAVLKPFLNTPTQGSQVVITQQSRVWALVVRSHAREEGDEHMVADLW
jgi:hypothetical protein